MVLVKYLRQCSPCKHAQVLNDCNITSKGRQGLIFGVQAAIVVTVKLSSLLQDKLRMLGQPTAVHPTAALCQKRLPGPSTTHECTRDTAGTRAYCASFLLTP